MTKSILTRRHGELICTGTVLLTCTAINTTEMAITTSPPVIQSRKKPHTLWPLWTHLTQTGQFTTMSSPGCCSSSNSTKPQFPSYGFASFKRFYILFSTQALLLHSSKQLPPTSPELDPILQGPQRKDKILRSCCLRQWDMCPRKWGLN